jgi:hypothetical protein
MHTKHMTPERHNGYKIRKISVVKETKRSKA